MLNIKNSKHSNLKLYICAFIFSVFAINANADNYNSRYHISSGDSLSYQLKNKMGYKWQKQLNDTRNYNYYPQRASGRWVFVPNQVAYQTAEVEYSYPLYFD